MSNQAIAISTQFNSQAGYAMTCVVDGATDDNIRKILRAAEEAKSEGLLLPGAMLTADGFSAINWYRSLRYLSLERANVSDQSLAALQNTSNLETLSLARTAVTGDVFQNWDLPQIALLDLCETEMTDATVQHLLRFPSLRTVRLSNTKITLSALTTLGRLPNVGIVWAQGNRITPFDIMTAPLPAAMKVLV
jgi:hypothetical protein